jgi:hypothetical protein
VSPIHVPPSESNVYNDTPRFFFKLACSISQVDIFPEQKLIKTASVPSLALHQSTFCVDNLHDNVNVLSSWLAEVRDVYCTAVFR